MVLSKDEMQNVASHYARQYEVEEHGHNHFYIYITLCQIKNRLVVSDKNKSTAKIPSRKEQIL